MADSGEFLDRVVVGMGQEATGYISSVSDDLYAAAAVMEAAIDLQSQNGADSQPSEAARQVYTDAAGDLLQISGQVLSTLTRLASVGLVDTSQITDQLNIIGGEGGELTFGIGEPAGELPVADDTTEPAEDADKTSSNLIDNLEVPSDTDPNTDPVDEKTRALQETLLTRFFGEGRKEDIAQLSQSTMIVFGQLLGEIYRNLDELGSRGKSTQAARADQFERYLAGEDRIALAAKYGIRERAFDANFRNAFRIIKREFSAARIDALFTETLAAVGAPATQA